MSNPALSEGALVNGRYRVIRPLGRGGMGSVYLAEHTRLHTTHALKQVLLPAESELQADEDLEERVAQCESEGQTLVRLEHPNLPRVTDAFVEGDAFYLVMEFIEGETLETRLKANHDRPLPIRDAVDYGWQVAITLAYLHALDPPIIFRDLKPANIMVQPDGRIRLIDFGIARRFQPGASRDTALLGSVGYSPPEQFGKAQTDQRSDIYSFGATLHHLLTGRDPIATPFKFLPVQSLNVLVPPALAALIGECVSMEPDARPPTMQAVADRLVEIRGHLPLDSIPSTSLSPSSGLNNSTKLPSGSLPLRTPSATISPEEPRGRNGLLIGIGALAAMACALGGYVVFQNKSNHGKEVPAQANLPVKPIQNSGKPIEIPQPKANEINPNAPGEAKPEATLLGATLVNVTGTTASGAVMEFEVRGTMKGLKGGAGTIALLFYDGSGAPLKAAPHQGDPPSNHPEGQLVVTAPLTVPDDPYSFDFKISVPVDRIPIEALANSLQYKAQVLSNTTVLTESPLAVLSLPKLPATPPDESLPQPDIPNPTDNRSTGRGGGTLGVPK